MRPTVGPASDESHAYVTTTPVLSPSVGGLMPRPISPAASGVRTVARSVLWVLGVSILLLFVVARVVGGLPRGRRP